jgi:hypothetical protein
LPSIRKRLQLLVCINHKKVIWNLEEVLKYSKNILSEDKRNFVIELDKVVMLRSEKFGKNDMKMAIKILTKLRDRINKELPKLIQ